MSARWRPPTTPQRRALACDAAVAGGDAIRARCNVLVIFSGPYGRPDGLPAELRRLGAVVVEIDTKVGGADHDLTRPVIAERLLARIRAGEFDAVFVATPCESFSIAHRPRLRKSDEPWGISHVPDEWCAYLAKHNKLARFSIAALQAALDVGACAAVENPAERGDVGSPAFWRRHRDHGSLWNLPELQALQLRKRTFSYCELGASYQKWTSIGHSADLDRELSVLDTLRCSHGLTGHAEVAHGRDAAGQGKANRAAAYPARMCTLLAGAITEAVARKGAAEARSVSGGSVTDGHALSEDVNLACEYARALRPKFASLRNLADTPAELLRAEALPGNLHAPMRRSKPPRAGGTKKGKVHPAALEGGSAGDCILQRPVGAIHISQLYMGDIYGTHVVPWLQRAEAAATALLRGERVPAVETLVIGQDSMPAWARGCVWDCSNPNDCRPVEWSTRDTVFAGRKQIDRAAFRAAAESLDWHDRDIVQQVGEGGVEVRSEAPLETVLAWHHRGFERELEAAERVIEADMEEEWVTQPVGHLPFVPCRLLPRNVVMQARTRVLADGSVEHYEKPRISQDGSDGAARSVNRGVPRHESVVTLPTAQAQGRALAICDSAGTTREEEEAGETAVRAEAYAIDATSAYRFCPLQRAHQYTQCFLYWRKEVGDDGRVKAVVGVCVDERMGFGGAYAPNRFERVSLMVAAFIQAAQAAFDAEQPPPPCTQRWADERGERLARGALVTHTLGPRPLARAWISTRRGRRSRYGPSLRRTLGTSRSLSTTSTGAP